MGKRHFPLPHFLFLPFFLCFILISPSPSVSFSLFLPSPFFPFLLFSFTMFSPHWLFPVLLLCPGPGSYLFNKSMKILWFARIRSPAQPKQIVLAQGKSVLAWKLFLWWSWAWGSLLRTIWGKSDVLGWLKGKMDPTEQQQNVDSK